MRLSTELTVIRGVVSFLILGVLLAPSAALSAQTLVGTVNNGTTGRAAAGDPVVLVTPGQEVDAAAHTRTDAGGRFTFQLPDAGPHQIRAVHQGVTYHRMVPPGTESVEVQVFDISRDVSGISVTADVMRFQAQGNELQGVRLFAVNNSSAPPRTQLPGKNFEFFLPAGAEIDQGMVMTPGGQPVNSAPVREREKNRYGFAVPLRPGETQLQVVFHMPYSGELSIDPRALYGAQHFVVIVPKSMQFTSAPGAAFDSMEDPRQSDALVRVVSNTRVGQPLNFKISGMGTLNEPGDDSQGAPHPVESKIASQPARDSHSEAVPETRAPEPLERYRWFILGAFGLLLVAGTIYFTRGHSRAVTIGRPGASGRQKPGRTSHIPAATDRSDLILEQLKNELFRLEVERQQGRISPSDYKRARARLDRRLDRVIKRSPRK